ncbi:MAG: response regulator [Prevotella sp.]|nr:response regulator [Prevotella sp.]
MKLRVLFSAISFWTLLPVGIYSQTGIHVRSRQLNAENGLSTNYVRSIVQDPSGYLWMGTTNGLIRYDGYTAELLTPDSVRNKLLFDERVLSLELWLDRFIWIKLRGRKYSCYDTQDNQFVDYTGENTAGESFQYSQIYNNGELWLFDPKTGCKVVRFDGKHFSSQRKKYSDLPKHKAPFIPSVLADHLSGKNYEIIKDNRNNQIVILESGELWHIDNKKNRIIHLLNIYSKELVRLNGKPRFGVVTDKDGLIWISTYGNGLFIHDPKSGETTHFLKTNSSNTIPIHTNYLLNIYEDRAGNIWVCQENMGVTCISKQKIHTDIINFSPENYFDHSNSIHLLSRVGNRIYVGNRYNGLKIADGILNFMQDGKSYGDDIVVACQDHAGTVWLGSRQSGIYVNGKNLHHDSNNPESLTRSKISDIACDSQGRIWISLFDGGVDLAVPDGRGSYTFRHFFTGKHAILHPRKLLLDHGGYMWVTSDVGLFVFRPEGLIKNSAAYQRLHVNSNTPESDEIHCIYEDSRHAVVVGTVGSGVAVFDNRNPGHAKLYQTFSTENGLPNNNIQQVIEDDKGYLWVGTDHGLARYDTKEMRTISLLPANTPQGNMFVENAVCRLDDGRLAFGSRLGIVVLDPHTVTINKLLFQLRITSFEVNGAPSSTTSLSHNNNSLVFRFSCFEYNEGVVMRYTYRLKGFDKEWSPLSKDNYATYKNLRPGEYTFEVRAQNSDGEWNETAIHLPITIHPPFWNTWWAYLIYLLLATALGFTVLRHLKRINDLRNRIKVEKELTEFKLQFFTNISHEFRTPLTIIRGAVERIGQAKEIPADIKLPVSLLQKSTDRMMRLVNQLLEFRKMQENKLALALEEADIITFVKDIHFTFHQTAESKHISYVFQPFAHHYQMFFDKNFVDKIVYNLLSNAFKYTMSHHSIITRITIDEQSQTISIKVEDTGIGIPEEKRKELFTRFNQSIYQAGSMGIGLNLTHELVKVHHGTITYQENPKGGSIFTVTLPTDKAVYAEYDFLVADNQLLVESDGHEQGKSLTGYKEMKPKPMNRQTILIVEDDNDIQEYLRHEIGRFFNVDLANNGMEAMERIRVQCPDLIISDVKMPVMNGYELTRKVKSDKETANIPIILLTAMTSEEKQMKGIEYGADAYFTKPFNTKLLIAQCKQLIEQRNTLRDQYVKEPAAQQEPTAEIITNAQDKRFKDTLETWIANHYSDANINIDALAENMKYGRTTFFKKVKKATGMTPNDYVRSYRMKKAAELITDDTLTVAEISYKVGFDDPYYFSKSFKAFHGVSPTQYRKGERGNNGI